jgi:serine/threonine-protein kinase RsbW
VTLPARLAVERRPVPEAGFSLRVPADLGLVEEAVDLVARHCLASGLPPRRARFNLRVALCEALANAIIYGNAADPSTAVDVDVTVTDNTLTLRVADAGPGFDPAAVPEPTVPHALEATGGRGLFLIRQLMDHVYFNDRGNQICMVLRRV